MVYKNSLAEAKKWVPCKKIMYFAFGFTTFAENLPTRQHLGGTVPFAP